MIDDIKDGFAAAQDAATYFGFASPSEDEYRRIRAEKDDPVEARADDTAAPGETVTLEDGGKKLTLDARVFAELLQAAEARAWNGFLVGSRLNLMAAEATERGLPVLAADLAKFGAEIKLAAAVRRPDGAYWSPRVPASRAPEQTISGAATRESQGDDTLGDEVAAYLDAAAAAEVDARRPGRRSLRPLGPVDDGELVVEGGR